VDVEFTFLNMIKLSKFRFATSVPRNPGFATVNAQDLAFLKDVCKSVLTDESEVRSFNTDWTKKWVGQSKVVVRPETTE